MKEKHLLGPNEIGAAIGVTGRTILNLEKRGLITADIRVNRIVRYNLETVLAQLAKVTASKTTRKQNKENLC